MKIQTGQGTIPLITLIGIFSISALNALPGLAVSPILGDLNKIFPSATDLEIQMLSSLPSLLIIPFILLSGKLTEKVNNLLLLQAEQVIMQLQLWEQEFVKTERHSQQSVHQALYLHILQNL